MNKLSWSSYDFASIPFDDIVHLGQRSLLYKDLFNVSWLLGRFCNYKCSYCWPYARSDKKDHRPLPVLLNAMDSIKSQARANNFNSFHFSFSGGEPTFHPDYLTLLKYYADDIENTNYQSCHMTTNLSRTLAYFEQYVATTSNLHRVSVTASWHREMAKKEEFREKLLFLQENDVYTTVNMVMVPKMFEEYYEEALYFHNAGINVTLKPQSDEKATNIVEGYTQDQIKRLHLGMPQREYSEHTLQKLGKKSRRPITEKLKNPYYAEVDEGVPANMQVELTDRSGKKWYLDQAERFNAFGFNKFYGWKCNAGFQGIVIREPDGIVKRSYSCHDAPIGHIEKGFKIFSEPAPCITKTCVSSVDNKMPKFLEINKI